MDASARLEFGGYRTGAQRHDADALGLQLAPKADGKRDNVGFRGVVDRHAGSRNEARDRRDVQNAAAMAREAGDPAQ